MCLPSNRQTNDTARFEATWVIPLHQRSICTHNPLRYFCYSHAVLCLSAATILHIMLLTSGNCHHGPLLRFREHGVSSLSLGLEQKGAEDDSHDCLEVSGYIQVYKVNPRGPHLPAQNHHPHDLSQIHKDRLAFALPSKSHQYS